MEDSGGLMPQAAPYHSGETSAADISSSGECNLRISVRLLYPANCVTRVTILLVRASSMTLAFERARGKNCIENAVNAFAVVRQRQRDGCDLNAIAFPFLVI